MDNDTLNKEMDRRSVMGALAGLAGLSLVPAANADDKPPTKAGGDKSLYDRLMTIKVWQCLSTTAYYVKAGNVSQSYIMNKLNGVNMCKETTASMSDQMPPPQPPENPYPYTVSAVDKALIQQWIVEGALNN